MARLMIVDDDEDFAKATAKVLKSDGHEVQIESTPEVALAHLEQRQPDLVILDVMFPEDSSAGFKLARMIRAGRQSLKETPILMLTAVNQKFPLRFTPEDIDGTWLPVTDFLEKPMDFDVLREKVSALVSKVNPGTVGKLA